MLQLRSSLKIGQALQFIRYKANHSQRELQSEGLGSHARMDLYACSSWHSKAGSSSAAATSPVAEGAVSSMKQAQEWQTVLELAQPKRQDAHDAPSCPLLKFITTEASQGGVIALTTTKITLQHDIVSFSQAGPVGRLSGVMAHGPAETLSPHGKTITNRKGTSRQQRARNVDLRSCAF